MTNNIPIVLLFLSDAILDSSHVLLKDICLKEFADSILILIFLKRVIKDKVFFLKRIACYFLHLRRFSAGQLLELRITICKRVMIAQINKKN